MDVIEWGGRPLASIIRHDQAPGRTEFLTPPDLNQQVGFIVYPKGGVVKRHLHRPVERRLVGNSEVLLVRSGHCELEIYNGQHELVATRELHAGDLVLLMGGGHGFRMLEDTVLLEVKLGPYAGPEEKELF